MRNLANLTVVLGLVVLGACATSGSKGIAGDLKVEEKVSINAPASKVWEKVSNFGDLGAWHPAVAKTEISGEANKMGAVRILTLQDGGTIKETLTSYSASGMTYAYVINEGVLPFSDYASKILVKPTQSGSEVIWTGHFKRKDLSATPVKGQDDEAAINTAHAVYRGGLDHLKKILEE
ncbi:MAG TPA: SRPBCC family protein [Methylophilaceae bacterium]|nr:SRPBCC family protein [Methylophilaceae bacterium]HAJ72092.1 SRPBCC family protein [Methylophilaceae bacterium]